LLDRCHEAQAGGLPGIPRDELLVYLRDAAEGIDFLQKRTIQHRDIKPQNLLLVGGRVKVGDFGLARLLANSVTGHTGSLTLAYAAPEFFEGKTTRQSDQYSLAVAYCRLRGGKLPFEGTPAAMVAAHLHRPPDLTMLPSEERPAVAKALSKKPGDRWPTCRGSSP
jgi:serine/threonine protein kinase